MYYLRKKAKYNVMKPITYTTTDVWFIKWICSIEKQWLNANRDMRYISPEHYIGQYIRGFKMLANVPWDTVDNIIIPVNVGESFHWIMVVFRIRLRCLYVCDSLIGGVVNTKNVQHLVQSLATMIPLFLVATEFYGKRADINWHQEPAYMDKSMTDPLEYVLLKDAPQQTPNSNDCGMFVCAFAEFVSHGVFEISSINFNAFNHRLRYGALLWDYARKKQDDGAISESEVTENVTSRLGGPKIFREAIPDVQKLHRLSLKNRKM